MNSLRKILALSLLAGLCLPGLAHAADPVVLEYQARYIRQGTIDHLMGVELIGSNRALLSSNRGLTVVDLDALTVDGTSSYLGRGQLDLDIYNTVTDGGEWIYANLRLGGLAVVKLGANFSLTLIGEISEPGVYYEKMTLRGDRLYVPAHAHGIRIFDISDRDDPRLIGSLSEGFTDAFAIAVEGDTAYVADGAGGIKIVDLSNETAPTLLGGENPVNAAGTAEDVLVLGNHVYVACGAAGVASYVGGDPGTRVLYDTPVAAKQLALAGNHLAVADIAGVEIFAIQHGSLTRVAGEFAQRRAGKREQGGGRRPGRPGGRTPTLTFRTWHGVAAQSPNTVVAANWDSMDVYEIVPMAASSQPDITVSSQRLHFPVTGGSATVDVHNTGGSTLKIGQVGVPSRFSAQLQVNTLQSGESTSMLITYDGQGPAEGVITLPSNDPDESPLPIQVFGETSFVDVGETAPILLPRVLGLRSG